MAVRWLFALAALVFLAGTLAFIGASCSSNSKATPPLAGAGVSDNTVLEDASGMIEEGQQIFRFDTFGDEDFWGGALKLHQAIAGDNNGGVGPGLTPTAALSLGLKVDADAVPADLVAQLQNGQVDLDDPAVTVALLKLNAVVGVIGFFDNATNSLSSVGITCAICHSTVDNTVSFPGIPAGNVGHRLDGWANRDLNIGAIAALAPDLSAVVNLLSIAVPGITDNDVRNVLRGWGVGKFDAELFLDGKFEGPRGSSATLIPPAYGMQGVNLHTWTGWGSVPYWNAFVANLEMHGKGRFYDPRLKDAAQFPIAAAAGFDNVFNTPDLITPKLAALHFYQLALLPPTPPAGSFDNAAAERGRALSDGKAGCARCHVPPLFTEPGHQIHSGSEIGIDDFQADRSPAKGYRTTPLRGLWAHQKGGFFHDGRFATLKDVVNHYDNVFNLGLAEPEKNDLVEFLKSI